MSYAKRVLVCLLAAYAPLALALSVEDLEALQAANVELVVIDVRSGPEYAEAHIPGAIHILAAVLERKQLPPFGRVVVCGDGLDVAKTRAAVEQLNAKPGIDAEMLDGGFSAWASHGRSTTRGAGLFDEFIDHLTYQELIKISSDNVDLVLIDLRTPGRMRERGEPAGRSGSSTDLAREFPDQNVIVPERARWTRYERGEIGAGDLLKGRRLADGAFYVLFDDGDGQRSEAMARRLRSKGLRRVAILAGGAVALDSRGRAGSRTVIMQKQN